MDLEIDNAVGLALRDLRKRKGLTQESLALEAGAERTYVSLIERGKYSPSVRMLYRLCAVMGVSPSELLSHADGLLVPPPSAQIRKRPYSKKVSST